MTDCNLTVDCTIYIYLFIYLALSVCIFFNSILKLPLLFFIHPEVGEDQQFESESEVPSCYAAHLLSATSPICSGTSRTRILEEENLSCLIQLIEFTRNSYLLVVETAPTSCQCQPIGPNEISTSKNFHVFPGATQERSRINFL
jgi:hypothetical protein